MHPRPYSRSPHRQSPAPPIYPTTDLRRPSPTYSNRSVVHPPLPDSTERTFRDRRIKQIEEKLSDLRCLSHGSGTSPSTLDRCLSPGQLDETLAAPGVELDSELEEGELKTNPQTPILEKDVEVTGQPSLSVPGVWYIQSGREHACILDCNFVINEDVVERWHLISPNAAGPSVPRLALRLFSFSADVAQYIQTDSETNSILADSLQERSKWPRKGTLLIEVNPDRPWGKSWLPFDPADPPLDLASYVHQGQNLIRLIQLDDLADNVFMLFASPLPRLEVNDIPRGTLGVPMVKVEVKWL